MNATPSRIVAFAPASAATVNGHAPAAAAVLPLADLLDQTRDFVRRFIVFPADEHAEAVALWIVHTHAVEAFDFTPYLSINSPLKRCGKSTLLDVLKLTAARSWPVVSPSPAVLFRKIEADCPTLLWDEVDTVFTTSKGEDGREDLRAVQRRLPTRGQGAPVRGAATHAGGVLRVLPEGAGRHWHAAGHGGRPLRSRHPGPCAAGAEGGQVPSP